MELIGIPHRVVISDRTLEAGNVEYAARRDGEKQAIAIGDTISHLQAQVAN